jgi:hypothetical protein
MKILFLAVASLLTAQVAMAALPMNLDGEYVQTGNCQCDDGRYGIYCKDAPSALDALNTSIFHRYGSSAISGEEVTLPDGTKKVVRVRFYHYGTPDLAEFRVREIDQLTYTVAQLDSEDGYQVTVKNLTLPQKDLIFKLKVPKNQEGGKIDGPEEIKTELGPNSVEINITGRYNGQSPMIDNSKWVQTSYDFARLKKLSDDAFVITTSFNYASRPTWAPNDFFNQTFNENFTSCLLTKKASN